MSDYSAPAQARGDHHIAMAEMVDDGRKRFGTVVIFST